jgi:hypothetical protein
MRGFKTHGALRPNGPLEPFRFDPRPSWPGRGRNQSISLPTLRAAKVARNCGHIDAGAQTNLSEVRAPKPASGEQQTCRRKDALFYWVVQRTLNE